MNQLKLELELVTSAGNAACAESRLVRYFEPDWLKIRHHRSNWSDLFARVLRLDLCDFSVMLS